MRVVECIKIFYYWPRQQGIHIYICRIGQWQWCGMELRDHALGNQRCSRDCWNTTLIVEIWAMPLIFVIALINRFRGVKGSMFFCTLRVFGIHYVLEKVFFGKFVKFTESQKIGVYCLFPKIVRLRGACHPLYHYPVLIFDINPSSFSGRF
jgi:hypothetical protein